MGTTITIDDEDDFENAIGIADAFLRSNGVVIYPTDTVYGIGCDANSREAIDKVHKIKGIEQKKPFSVMMADLKMVEEYCETGIWEDIILRKYLPGPYTFLLKSKGLCAASSNKLLGVRIPDSEFCQAMCRKLGRPIVTTSANRTSSAPPIRFEDIDKKMVDSASVAIDSGPTKYGAPSVIIDLVQRKLIRQGGEEIDLVELGQEISSGGD
jgi:tRNA threonylcarbamoyl adenosine modification protein (Sua5/YciO/YrdC/YwlC family)